MGELNLELFRKIRDRIATIPESYNQNSWFTFSSIAPCGTTACLAGETIICAAPTVAEGIARLRGLVGNEDDEPIPEIAAELLGLEGDFWSARGGETDIFCAHASAWPEPFRSQFRNGDEATAAVAYLDWIIANNRIFPDDKEPK